MNYVVLNENPSSLRTSVYGACGVQLLPVAVDTAGELIMSPQSSITVTATDLDIRNLSGAQDSVLIYGNNFVESNTGTTLSVGTTYLLARDISAYGKNSFYIRNTGSYSVTVTLQIAPVNDDNYYVDNSSAQSVGASSNYAVMVTIPLKYARLKVVATNSTSIVAYYNGQA